MITYFTFSLPKQNGYSSDWCGECFVPKNPNVLLYNEQAGIGLASCDTEPIDLDPNLTPISEAEAIKIMDEVEAVNGQAGIFVGKTLRDKWLREVVGIEQVPVVDIDNTDDIETSEKVVEVDKKVVDSKGKFCNLCHALLGYELSYSDGSYALKLGQSMFNGIAAGQTINVQCRGHKAKVTVSGRKQQKVVGEPEPEIPIPRFCPVCYSLITLRAKDTPESAVEEYIPIDVVEEYKNDKYAVYTCPNGHRVKEVSNG